MEIKYKRWNNKAAEKARLSIKEESSFMAGREVRMDLPGGVVVVRRKGTGYTAVFNKKEDEKNGD